MGKKKFIDKKKSAIFQLRPRDSSTTATATDAADTSSDLVFHRVDNNEYSVNDPNSIFADAADDTDGEDDDAVVLPPWGFGSGGVIGSSERVIGDDVRKEILELGLPDDGYNYLTHLREIRSSGNYFHNSKAKLNYVDSDVKAYDASRIRINSEEKSDPIYAVAAKTVGVKVQRALDPEVVRLLDDSDLSRCGSDDEGELDEDFVVKANLPDGVEEEEEVKGGEKPRIRRLIDEQFDKLTLEEYDSDGGGNGNDYDAGHKDIQYGDDNNGDDYDAGHKDVQDEPLAAKLNDALKYRRTDDLDLIEKYRVPADLVQESSTGIEVDTASDVIRKCVEYAEKYCSGDKDDEEVVIVEESSDESEAWDCETIVSTYSNLDNHPGKIQAPENPKRRIPKYFPGESVSTNNVITLRGKEKLPVDFLSHNRKAVEKVKTVVNPGTDKQNRKPHGEESKEEKKERKAAVKEERREARRAKKELKGIYRCEAQKAQKVAAFTGASSIHLM